MRLRWSTIEWDVDATVAGRTGVRRWRLIDGSGSWPHRPVDGTGEAHAALFLLSQPTDWRPLGFFGGVCWLLWWLSVDNWWLINSLRIGGNVHAMAVVSVRDQLEWPKSAGFGILFCFLSRLFHFLLLKLGGIGGNRRSHWPGGRLNGGRTRAPSIDHLKHYQINQRVETDRKANYADDVSPQWPWNDQDAGDGVSRWIATWM